MMLTTFGFLQIYSQNDVLFVVEELAEWIEMWTFLQEVFCTNLPAATVESLGKALYPHCPVPQKGLKAVSPPVPGQLLVIMESMPKTSHYIYILVFKGWL